MPPRTSADPEKLAAAVRVVLDKTMSQRAACKRYGVPKTTLSRAVKKAREGVDRTGPDQRTGSGPDRTGPNQTPVRGEERAREVARDARLTAPQMRAATMVVAAQHTHAQIAAEVGVGTTTLTRWKQDPVFQAVMADLRTACHLQAREALARGAEKAVQGMSAATELFERLNRKALDLLKRLEDGDEDVTMAEVQIAVKTAVEASRLIPAGRALMDAGGFPKTERVEVTTDRADEGATPLERGKSTRARLKLLQGGAT